MVRGTYRYSDTRYSDTRYSDTHYSDTFASFARGQCNGENNEKFQKTNPNPNPNPNT